MISDFKRKSLGFMASGGDSGGGGGGGGPTTNTSYQVALQPELMPYATDIAKKAQDLSSTDYTPYRGQRIADFTQAQQQQQAETMGMRTPDQFGQGSQATRMAGLGSLMAGQNYASQATDPGSVAAYMSPYMQNAVDAQKQQAMLDYQRTVLPQQQAQAVKAGAFGGNRAAIVGTMGDEALNRQLGQIQATGTQNAYQDAMRSMQYGNTLGLQGLGQAGQMAGQLAQIGGAEQQANLARLQAQGQVGQQQQGLQQQQLSQNYQDFLKQQEYPYSQLSFYNSMIRGLQPVMPTTTQTYTSPPSTAAQLGGLGLGAYSLGKMMG
jgi:hypothetical protein